MDVNDLIKALMKVKNKNKGVYIFSNDEIFDIDMIDDSIDDRLDINIKEQENILDEVTK
jgi:hypothetical protein